MILDAELAGGGWAWSGDSADPDLTANALQALAPYYNTNTNVKETVERGLQALSAIQNPDGSFSSWGTQNACSTAQVLTALTSLGIDPLTDSRFVKNGYTILQGLGDFYINGSGFRYDFSSTEADLPFSTVQGAYALTSYQRFVKGENRLFDMTDAVTKAPEPTTETLESTSALRKDHSPATGDSMPAGVCLGLVAAMAGSGILMRRNKR